MNTVFSLRPATILAAFAVLAACQDEAAPDGAIPVPSGRVVLPIDVITNVPGTAGAAARFRFLAPDLTEDDLEGSAGDMQKLCDTYALPKTTGTVPEPQQIIISLSAAEVPFGEPAPDVVQFFETYRIEGGVCVVDLF